MTYINQLSSVSSLSAGDQLPIYAASQGDTRRVSLTDLLSYFQTQFASPTVSTTVSVPTTGFSIGVPTPVSQQQWLILQPIATLATGTITLPLNTATPDGTEVLLSTTQEITALTIGLNGAAALYGWTNPATLAAGGRVRVRFYSPLNTWYRID